MLQKACNTTLHIIHLITLFTRQAFCINKFAMSEMLGNHYYLSRNYAQAIDAFSKTFNSNFPSHILKKLIICHITQGNIKTAKEYFLKVINDNPLIIIKTDVIDEDCPCPDIIDKLENNFHPPASLDDLISLGILWLYCDLDKSVDYFKQANRLYPNDQFILQTMHILNSIHLTKRINV